MLRFRARWARRSRKLAASRVRIRERSRGMEWFRDLVKYAAIGMLGFVGIVGLGELVAWVLRMAVG